MATTEHIVVVDDDPEIRDLIQPYLTSQGYEVSTAADGRMLRDVLQTKEVDLVILDLVMPGEDGLALTRFLRRYSSIGIIILTGKDGADDTVVGLEMGADDYLAKPFSMRELLARIRSVLRRTEAASDKSGHRDRVVRFDGWALDLASRRLTSAAGEHVGLTRTEFALLAAMVANPSRVLSRDQILELVKHSGDIPVGRSVDVLIFRLRRKIERNPKRPVLIKTARGAGYMFTPAIEAG